MLDNVTKIRMVQLDLLREFSRVCTEHNLKWYACFGTLLGAVRHQGFLPLDDDVDVLMPLEDYRILCVHKEWFSEGCYLQTPSDEGFYHYAKLRKDGTIAIRGSFVESLKRGGHLGVPLDIIPMEEVHGKDIYHTPALQNEEKLAAVYQKEWFEPAGEMLFEGVKIRVPAKYRKVLTACYGDWCWPQRAQQAKLTYWFSDTETDYSFYVRRYTGMLDAVTGENADKKICLFGAADSLRIWLERFGMRDRVICTYDNDPAKWGAKCFGVEVHDPAELRRGLPENSCMIIVSVWFDDIGRQLQDMGITDYYVYLDEYYDETVGKPVIRRDDVADGNLKMPRWVG